MHPKIDEFFGKVTSAKFKLNFGGPAGGSALEIFICFINVGAAVAKADCSF